ncbi:MAG: SsrA-binding protein SmpB [Acidimicrobiales bacterium]
MPSKGRLAAQRRRQHDKERGITRVAQNRRARHDYEILETFECGLALTGAEVKSIRAGHISLQEAYARVEHGEAYLVGARVAPYEYATGFGRFDPDRSRKILLHRAEIDELAGRVAQKSLTLVPLSVYFRDGHAKLELGLARGRRLYDKRRALAERDAARETERAIKAYESR